MSSRTSIRTIKQSIGKPHVGRPGVTAAFSPARGKTAVMKGPRIQPINTRIYGKDVTAEDPSDYFKSSFYDEGLV